MIEQERSKVCRVFDLHFVKRLLWAQDQLPPWVLWLIWWPLPWLRLTWVQDVTGQVLVQHSDAASQEVIDYGWYSTAAFNAAAQVQHVVKVAGPQDLSSRFEFMPVEQAA